MTEFGNFAGASKTDEFADSSCNPERVTLTAALGGDGGRFTISSADPDSCYGDTSQQRVHMLGFADSSPPSLEPGAAVAWCSSIRRRAGSIFDGITLHEIHGDHVSCRIAAGPAPFNFQCRSDGGTARWAFILRGWDDCGPPAPAPPIGFVQHQFGAPATLAAVGDGSSQGDRVPHAWAGGLSDEATADEWLHWLCYWDPLASDPTLGKFTAWACKGTAAPVMVPIVPELELATCYPVDNYPILSLYYANAPGTADYEYAAGAIFNNLEECRAWQTARLETFLGGDPWTGFGGGGGGGGGGATDTVAIPVAANDDDHQLDRIDTVYADVPTGSFVLDGDGTNVVIPSRGKYGSDFYIGQGAFRFDTAAALAAYPGWLVTGGRFKFTVTVAGGDDNARNLVIDLAADFWPVGSADWADNIAGAAYNGDLTPINVAADHSLELTIADEDVSRVGYTVLRVGVSGGEPAGQNHVNIATKERVAGIDPTLELDIEEPAGAGGGRATLLLLAA